MACRSYGDSGRRLVLYAENPDQVGGEDCAGNAGYDHGKHGKGKDAAPALGKGQGNRRGDALGKQAVHNAVVHTEQAAHDQDRGNAGRAACHGACDNRHDVRQQHLALVIHGNGKNSRYRRQHGLEDVGTALEAAVGNMQHLKEGHHQDCSHQQGIQELAPALLLDKDGDSVKDHAGNYAEAYKYFSKAYEYSKNYSYPLMMAVCNFKQNDSFNAKKVLTALLKTLERDSVEYNMVRFYNETYSRNAETNLVQKINKLDDSTKRGKMLFYLGLYYELNGAEEFASEYYTKVTAMQAPMFFEYRFAEWSLGL